MRMGMGEMLLVCGGLDWNIQCEAMTVTMEQAEGKYSVTVYRPTAGL
jgi:hypothetical protein